MTSFKMTLMSTALALFTLLHTFPRAAALPLVRPRDVFVPPILYPDANTVWVAGNAYNVTWNTTNAPAQISNRASIVLKTRDLHSGFGMVTLARDFSLREGWHEIQVPSNVTTRNDYIIVLFGDSGNMSPPFTIYHEE